jgi:branched-chain amino acid transport system substrate-binding protein
MAAAATFVQALEHAGPHPTRQTIVAAANNGSVNHGGPGLVPFDFSPTDHDGCPGAQIGTIDNGGLQLTGPVYYASDDGSITAQPPSVVAPPATF